VPVGNTIPPVVDWALIKPPVALSTTLFAVFTVKRVTPLAWRERLPVASAVVTTPVIPETTPLSALIVDGMSVP
jgi:hypothetical protein